MLFLCELFKLLVFYCKFYSLKTKYMSYSVEVSDYQNILLKK